LDRTRDPGRHALARLTNGKSETFAEGESWDGRTLAKVLPDRVLFRQRSEIIVLVTPHVVRDAASAQSATDELRAKLAQTRIFDGRR
jgi:hypothetical protein